MFGLIKEMFIVLLNVCILVSFARSLPSKEPTKCLTLNNRPCKARPTLVNIKSDETLFFFPFTVSVSKCGRSCNTINVSYARVCVLFSKSKKWSKVKKCM